MSKEDLLQNNPIPFEESVMEAHRLLKTQKIFNPDIRKEMIIDLFQSLATTNIDDTIGIQTISDKVQQLLITDPLTDQQAGIVTRWMQETGYLGQGSYEEALFLRTAYWADIEAFCTSKKRWKTAWKKSLEASWEGDHVVKVYRGMKLTPKDIKNIYEYGIISPGFYRYGRFSKLLMRYRYFKFYLNHPDLEAWTNKNLMLIEGPISKGGLLRNHWHIDSDTTAVDTPESLGISTTLPETICTATKFGKHVIEMQIPANRLVARWEEPGMIDYSILYLVEPSEIKMIYEVDNTDYFLPKLKPLEK